MGPELADRAKLLLSLGGFPKWDSQDIHLVEKRDISKVAFDDGLFYRIYGQSNYKLNIHNKTEVMSLANAFFGSVCNKFKDEKTEALRKWLKQKNQGCVKIWKNPTNVDPKEL